MAAVETETTEVRAQARWVHSAPRKAQLVVDEIRGLPVEDALTVLSFMTRAAARDVESVLKPKHLFWVLIAAAVVQAAYYFPSMPDPMASHFGPGGRADGFQSRSG